MGERYTFSRLTADDLPLLRVGLERPHVAQWWPDAACQAAEIANHCSGGDTVPWLASLDGRPFAYLQCSRESADTCGIDQFIGEAELLGCGHGSALIRQFCDGLLAGPSVAAVTTDPDPANARAVRAYHKAGFRPIGPRSTPWGRVLLMRRDKEVASPSMRASST
jgi:aminoglycoside 6'-N-acetyltransferase